MKSLDEIREIRSLKIEMAMNDGGCGHITIGGKRCSVVFSWGGGWEHVSCSPTDSRATLSWDNMCELKDLFWNDDEAVVQYHPRKADYVNLVNNCLHLWRPTDQELPIPPKIYV